jgi:hypothetical protein
VKAVSPGEKRRRSGYPGLSFPRAWFAEVGIKKKSFCGSLNSDKPCLRIDFAKFADANKPLIQNLIGSRYLTLNNSL